jgi:NADPH-dependent ferric siderophore reductase
MSRLQDLVADTVSNRLFHAMRVTQVSDRGPFREISLTSVTPRVSSWTPGDKTQVRVPGGGLTMRTYTPVRWENTSGDTTILVYLHGAGPGSAWAQTVAADDSVQVVGPRRSIDLRRFTSAPIFVVGLGVGDRRRDHITPTTNRFRESASHLRHLRPPRLQRLAGP